MAATDFALTFSGAKGADGYDPIFDDGEVLRAVFYGGIETEVARV